LPAIVRSFSASFPDIALDLRELTTAQQLTALRAHQIDVGLMRAHAPVAGILVERLLAEPLVAALPVTSPLTNMVSVSVADLREEPWVMFPRSEGSGLHEQLLNVCRSAGFEPKVVQEATQMQTLVGLVAGGIGVALAPASAMRIQATGVIYRPLGGPQHTVPLLLGWRGDEAEPVLGHFLASTRALRDAGALAQSAST
jgi:DNA-binding transcriptional LysR family regulator